jgi:hypothetical protein
MPATHLRTSHLALALLAALHATLHAQVPDAPMPTHLAHQWQRIANLPPGTPILVADRTRSIPTQCDLLWIDTTALACTTVDPIAGPQRTIFPATSILSVQPAFSAFQADRPHFTGPIIAATIGAVLGGIAGSHQSVGGAFAGTAIGALIFGGVAISIPPPYPAPRPLWSVRIPVGHPHRP